MYNFCSITSINHVYQTIALINCLKNEKINILCLDKSSLDFFLRKKYKKVNLFSLDDLNYQDNINHIKKNRSYLEFIFTLKPIFLYFIFKGVTKKSKIVYLDSDIFFFGDIKHLKKSLKNYSIFLTEHNFSCNNLDKKKYGFFNAGFIAFRKDIFGSEALKWWMKSCIKKCSFEEARNHFFDQKYLDKFSKKFKKVKFINKNLYNIAPWNIDNLISKNHNHKNIKIIFFHFQGFRVITSSIFQLGFTNYHVSKEAKKYLNKIYFFYCLKIKSIIKKNQSLKNINFYVSLKLFIKAFLKNDLIFIK